MNPTGKPPPRGPLTDEEQFRENMEIMSKTFLRKGLESFFVAVFIMAGLHISGALDEILDYMMKKSGHSPKTDL